MEALLCCLVGLLSAAGVYLMLERHLLRVLFGLVLISNSVNLAILTAGRLTRGKPPIIPQGMTAPPPGSANPLPQALILTAIVIGFGLLIFVLLLIYRAYRTSGTADLDRMLRSEKENP